ncbi:MAG: helix-turn-helix transcriptional regulator [Cyclobacteriaceae bacterium]
MADKLIGPYFFEKLKLSRKLIGLTQRQMAADLGRKQRDVSLIENGVRNKLIPHDYIAYLHSKGIDLNWLYDPEDIDSMDEEELKHRAFKHKGKAVYYLVHRNKVDRLIKAPENEWPRHFMSVPLPGIAADGQNPYVGFVVGKDTPPWQAEDIVICRRVQPTNLKPGADYLVISNRQVTSKTMGGGPASGSDEYIHWLDNKMPVKNIDQLWEPVRSLVGSIGSPMRAASFERQREPIK